MFGKILKRTFWSWWDNLSFSILNSFLASINPFFIVLLSSLQWIIRQKGETFVGGESFFVLVIFVCVMAMHTFPTTVAAYGMQERLINGEVVSFFKEYWAELKKVFWRSMLLTLVCGLAGLLLGFSINFWQEQLGKNPPWNHILLGVSLFFAVLIYMSQMLILPLVIREKIKFVEYWMVSVFEVFKKAPLMLGIFFINLIAFFVFSIPAVEVVFMIVPILAYFGFANTLHTWTYKYVFEEVPADDGGKKRQFREIFSPFTNIVSGYKKAKAEHEQEKKQKAMKKEEEQKAKLIEEKKE